MTTIRKMRIRGYKVKTGCAVSVQNPLEKGGATLFKAGEVIPPEALTTKQAEEHLRSGYVERSLIKTSIPDNRLTDQAPGKEAPTPITFDPEEEVSSRVEIVEKSNRIQINSGKNRIKTSVEIKDTVTPPKIKASKWGLNPDNLEELDLEKLNVMVAERDTEVTLFETKEEAIAQLSMEFDPEE